MKVSKLNDKKLFISVIVVVVMLMSFLSYNKVNDYMHIKDQIRSENLQIKDSKAKIKTYSDIQYEMFELMSRGEKITGLLPGSRDESGIVSCITGLGMYNNVDVSGVSFEKDENKDKYIRIPFRINAQGKYADIMKLISEMSDANRLFKVDTLSIAQNKNSGSLLNIEINASAYYAAASK